MKKEYNIRGLDCGHCALTLEKYLAKVNGVKSCSINFSTSKLFLDIDDKDNRAILKNIYKTIKEVNPDVSVSEENNHDNKNAVIDKYLYVVGLVVGLSLFIFKMPTWLNYTILIISALLMGYRTYWKAILQLKTFKINENTLLTISVFGAIAIGESMEGLMVIALYTFGKFLESRAVNYSRKSISALIENQPDIAHLVVGKTEVDCKPEEVKLGDIIVVRAGEKIPLDGDVVEGKASIDKSHLTGESEPALVKKGMSVLSGSIVLDSTIKIRVTSVYKDCAVSKILDLVSNATNKKSKTETVISKFASFYTLGVIIFAIGVWGITWAVTKNLELSIYRGLISLVVSCPCAFAISVPLTYFSGIGRCSKQGILIKGSNFIDTCAGLNEIVFDKTGTLTNGKFKVSKIETFNKFKKEKILQVVVAGERNSLHPIAKAICDFYGKTVKLKEENYKENVGKGISYTIGKNNYVISKSKSTIGKTIINVEENDVLIGKIYLSDNVKPEAKDAIKTLQGLGIKTMMLTGDNNKVAHKVFKELELDEYSAELLPTDKFRIIQEQKQSGKKVGFVGDGLNDAPALTLSDAGISMGIMGSPATIAASDIVIADDNLKQLPRLIKISKKTKRIVWGNILFSAITKLTFLVLGALGITGMLLAVFADVGVTLIAIVNSLRVLIYKCEK